ncbi:MAG: flagellar motor protein MotD [Pseudomonas sp.]
MARRKRREEHSNHEAWAIPYADLLTLLLAFFVVMYAISSLNENKYRIVADALTTAFGGAPRTINPVQLGNQQVQGSDWDRPTPIKSGARQGSSAPSPAPDPTLLPSMASQMRMPVSLHDQERLTRAQRQMDQVARQLSLALAPLIDARLITVRRNDLWIEVEINSDILFPTGSATLDHSARETLSRLAAVLRAAPNGMRVEGYTDNQPIATTQFPSNWELSAARAASVVHLFADEGIAPRRLAMVGYGEFRPRADNGTEAGRNANRRVVLIILADSGASLAPEPPRQAAAPEQAKTNTRGAMPGNRGAMPGNLGAKTVPAMIEGEN